MADEALMKKPAPKNKSGRAAKKPSGGMFSWLKKPVGKGGKNTAVKKRKADDIEDDYADVDDLDEPEEEAPSRKRKPAKKSFLSGLFAKKDRKGKKTPVKRKRGKVPEDGDEPGDDEPDDSEDLEEDLEDGPPRKKQKPAKKSFLGGLFARKADRKPAKGKGKKSWDLPEEPEEEEDFPGDFDEPEEEAKPGFLKRLFGKKKLKSGVKRRNSRGTSVRSGKSRKTAPEPKPSLDDLPDDFDDLDGYDVAEVEVDMFEPDGDGAPPPAPARNAPAKKGVDLFDDEDASDDDAGEAFDDDDDSDGEEDENDYEDEEATEEEDEDDDEPASGKRGRGRGGKGAKGGKKKKAKKSSPLAVVFLFLILAVAAVVALQEQGLIPEVIPVQTILQSITPVLQSLTSLLPF